MKKMKNESTCQYSLHKPEKTRTLTIMLALLYKQVSLNELMTSQNPHYVSNVVFVRHAWFKSNAPINEADVIMVNNGCKFRMLIGGTVLQRTFIFITHLQ